MAYYTPAQRKQIAAIYRNALRTLPDIIDGTGNSEYICDNIGYTAGWAAPKNISMFDARSAAKDIIAERIDRCFSIERWLKEQSDEIYKQVQDDVDNNKGRKLQAYRKQWLGMLIKEFEGK
jgi:hypothetical protein